MGDTYMFEARYDFGLLGTGPHIEQIEARDTHEALRKAREAAPEGALRIILFSLTKVATAELQLAKIVVA